MADAPQRPITAGPPAAPVGAGLVPRVLQSWWAPRRVVAGLADMPDRALLALLMAALLILWLAQMPAHARAAAADPAVPLAARMGGAALAVLFIAPLFAYALAALVPSLARLGGLRLAPRHSRLALFWALLAVAPAMLLSGLVAGLIGPGPALGLTRWLAGIGFLMIWGAGLAALVQR